MNARDVRSPSPEPRTGSWWVTAHCRCGWPESPAYEPAATPGTLPPRGSCARAAVSCWSHTRGTVRDPLGVGFASFPIVEIRPLVLFSGPPELCPDLGPLLARTV